jgi:hypothetical protein
MSRRLSQGILEAFPKIFPITAAPYSILCGDGWHALLIRSLDELQSFCDLCSDGAPQPVQIIMEQVQERDGVLKLYYRLETASDLERETIDTLVRSAERSSLCFCEMTGESPACLCYCGFRLRTLCPQVASRMGYKPYSDCQTMPVPCWQGNHTSTESVTPAGRHDGRNRLKNRHKRSRRGNFRPRR